METELSSGFDKLGVACSFWRKNLVWNRSHKAGMSKYVHKYIHLVHWNATRESSTITSKCRYQKIILSLLKITKKPPSLKA